MRARVTSGFTHENGHRFDCADPYEANGACNCDKPYRLRRRLIIFPISTAVVVAIITIIILFATYAPDLGTAILQWFFIGLMCLFGAGLVGGLLWSVAILVQKVFWE